MSQYDKMLKLELHDPEFDRKALKFEYKLEDLKKQSNYIYNMMKSIKYYIIRFNN